MAAGPKDAISFDSPAALVGDAILLMVVAVVVASGYFAYSPRRWLAVPLFLISLVTACLAGYGLWTRISLIHVFGQSYFHVLRADPIERFWLFAAAVFATLAVMWSAIWFRLHHPVRTKT
jgi:hypothetical protein